METISLKKLASFLPYPIWAIKFVQGPSCMGPDATVIEEVQSVRFIALTSPANFVHQLKIYHPLRIGRLICFRPEGLAQLNSLSSRCVKP